MMRPRFEVSDVIHRFGEQFAIQRHPNRYQQKVLRALTLCRTAELGWHKERCDCCHRERISYNSCGNRHCPKCQSVYQAFWIEDLLQMTLPVKHYHIVFTVPHELNTVSMLDSRWFYNLLFSAVWDILRAFGYTHYGVEGGAVMVLQTWGENLSLHPHMHCIVPAAGQSLAGNMKHIGKGGKYLYPVTQLSVAFRKKMMNSIKCRLIKQKLWEEYKTPANTAWKKPWNVHCEPAYGKPEHIVRYLGRYTCRVAISNHRILNIDDYGVRFIHKDYRDNAKQKPITLTGVEFLHRFCLHILPVRFVKIRYFGIYSSRFRAQQHKANPKMTIKPKQESAVDRIKRLTGFDVCRCPFCKKGTMRIVEVVTRIRSPTNRDAFLSSLKVSF